MINLVLADAVVWLTWTDAHISDYDLDGHTDIPSEEACKQLCLEVGNGLHQPCIDLIIQVQIMVFLFILNIKKVYVKMAMERLTSTLCFIQSQFVHQATLKCIINFKLTVNLACV